MTRRFVTAIAHHTSQNYHNKHLIYSFFKWRISIIETEHNIVHQTIPFIRGRLLVWHYMAKILVTNLVLSNFEPQNSLFTYLLYSL